MDGLSVKSVIYKNFFVFHQNLIKLGDVVSSSCLLQLHQVSLNSDEKQKHFI